MLSNTFISILKILHFFELKYHFISHDKSGLVLWDMVGFVFIYELKIFLVFKSMPILEVDSGYD